MFTFGTGNVFVTPANLPGTGVQIGTLQDIQIDFDQSTQKLYGQNKYPDAVAQAEMSITGKAKSGKFSLNLANTIILNETISSGTTKLAINEAGAIPGTSTYTITVDNSATFVADLGVRKASDGTPFTRVASGPAAGEYTVSAGVYTFAAADASTNVLINYTYTTTGGQTLVGAQQLMGSQQAFTITLQENDPTNGNTLSLTLYRCVGSKLTMPLKNNNFMVNDIEFECYANSSGVVYELSTEEGSIAV